MKKIALRMKADKKSREDAQQFTTRPESLFRQVEQQLREADSSLAKLLGDKNQT